MKARADERPRAAESPTDGTRDRAGADERAEGNRLMASGVAIGLVGTASAVLLGATCPLCVVGAPALVGWGAYKRYKARTPRDE